MAKKKIKNNNKEENLLVHIGTFGKPQGLNGEIKLNILTNNHFSFQELNNYFLEDDKKKLIFKKFKQIGKKIIVLLEGYNDRNSTSELQGKKIFTMKENFPKPKNNEYYVLDLVGCVVKNNFNNNLGIVIGVDNFGAGDLLKLKNQSNKHQYIPMDKDNLISVDIKKKIIIAKPLPGLID